KKEEIKIEGKDTFKMLFTAKKLSEIKFSDIKGDITVATVYKTMAGELGETDERLTITRSYVGDNEKAGTTFNASEYVKVVLKIRFANTAPTGIYMVEDYLPASLRYVSAYTKANNRLVDKQARWYPHEILGQKVSFYIYHHNKDNRERTIEYFARVSSLGQFTADSAAVFNLESNVTAYTPRTVITIK
ncbi:MAG: hypothetical protein PHV32_13360, partial [Eubacteriales bacterium]|nr:hypothetical protein [Eubacteriales bacterium]